MILFFNSCNKDKWNEPTTVNFIVDVNREEGHGGKLYFLSGSIVLGDFTFDGKRVQGDDVYFKNNFSSGLKIDFNQNVSVGDLNFEIPQGTFTKIQISFSTVEMVGENQIELDGIFNSGAGDEINVHFEFNAVEKFTVLSQSASGSPEIVLKKETPMTPKMVFDPIYWFQPVPIELLNNAEIIDIESVPTILINSTTNPEIYNIIVSRIGDGVKIIF